MTKDQSKNSRKIVKKSSADFENKKPETAIEKFHRELSILLAKYHSDCLSECIRRGIAAKKMRDAKK